MVFPILGGGSVSQLDTSVDIPNSCMFNGTDSIFQHTFEYSLECRRTWSFSAWIKIGNPERVEDIFGCPPTGEGDVIYMDPRLSFFHNGSSSSYVRSKMKLQDPGAWYHIALQSSTRSGNQYARLRLAVNGWAMNYVGGWTGDHLESTTMPGINYDAQIGTAIIHELGTGHHNSLFSGHMANVAFVDGTDYGETTFAHKVNGIWRPRSDIISQGLTWGANGFFLEFKQNGTGTNSSGLGADTSGEDNHMELTSGLSAVNQSTDSPTNNFATMQPCGNNIDGEAGLYEGNLKYIGGTTSGQGAKQMAGGTFGVSRGKWYFEVKRVSGDAYVGVYAADHPGSNIGFNNPFTSAWNGYSHGIFTDASNARSGNADSSYGAAGIDDNDIIGIALDCDNKAIYYSDNGTFMNSGDPTSGASKTGEAPNFPTGIDTWILGFIGDGASGASSVYQFNFGNPPYANSSSVADANGYGAFEYAPPAGYYAPCTKNLALYG
tara:strand:- start:1127 stop:2599 length:1473 start_codon:yes stop_codon:yes gene_type:complete